MNKEIAIDPVTGEQFEKTRSNKIFKTTKNKTKFHNDKAKIVRHLIAPIQKPLSNNRKILEEILGNSDSVIVSQDYLLGAKYNFNFYTASDKNQTIFLIYDFEMTIFEDKLKIRRRN